MAGLYFDEANRSNFECMRASVLKLLAAFALFSGAIAGDAFARDLSFVPEAAGPKRSVAGGQIAATGGYGVAESRDVGNGIASPERGDLVIPVASTR